MSIIDGNLNSIKVFFNAKNDLNEKKISYLYSVRYGLTVLLTINKLIYF